LLHGSCHPKKLLTQNHRIDRIRTHKIFVCPSLHLDDELVIVFEGIRHFMIRENLSGLYHGLLLHHFKITVTAAELQEHILLVTKAQQVP